MNQRFVGVPEESEVAITNCQFRRRQDCKAAAIVVSCFRIILSCWPHYCIYSAPVGLAFGGVVKSLKPVESLK